MKKIIFIDVDGVLNRDELFGRGGYTIDPVGTEHLNILKEIVDQTGAKLVLSSSWRCSQNSRETISRSLKTVDLSYIDMTPVLDARLPRSSEIQLWLDNNPDTEKFAILDDDPDAEITGHFFQTTFQEGLTEEIGQAVIAHLNT